MTELLNSLLLIWTIFTYLMYVFWALLILFIIVVVIKAYISIWKEYRKDE